jgi:glyoxylase-like metal-dependent hydrolase (beta-lactamase superfamily II)
MNKIHLLEIDFEYNGQQQTIWPVLLKDDLHTILVDCGYPDFLPMLEEAAAQHKVEFSSITTLILTHHDMDHIGSAGAIKRKYPHIEILAYEQEAQYLNGTKKSLRVEQAESTLSELSDEEKINAEHFIRFLESVEPVQVDRILSSNEHLPWCGGIDVIHTPGHMPGHISLYLPASKTLIAADAVVIENGKFNIANPQYAMDLEQAVQSVKRLMDYDISQVICYHGGQFQGDVKKALEQLVIEFT